jgi:hypothetical protein
MAHRVKKVPPSFLGGATGGGLLSEWMIAGCDRDGMILLAAGKLIHRKGVFDAAV